MSDRDLPGPVPDHPGWDHIADGDPVRVTRTGRTGVALRKVASGYWLVRWDEPRFGATEGRIPWVELERLRA